FEMHINENVVEVAAPKDNESDVVDNTEFEMHINENVVEVAAPKDNELDVVDNAEVIVKRSAR
ncbi:hypothetical protein Tco_1307901, partial [Tanacetum coccineum]